MAGAWSVFLVALAHAVCASAQPRVVIAPSAAGPSRAGSPPGRYVSRHVRLIDHAAYAYGLRSHRVIAPEWFAEARYDITVDAAGGDARALLRGALEEKFSIVAGIETRSFETWVLECPHPEKLAGAELIGSSATGGPGFLHGATSLDGLAGMLRFALKTDVVDETGVGGHFRFSIKWQPGDTASLLRALEDAGLKLSREHREDTFLVIYSAYWPDAPKPQRYPCSPSAVLQAAIEALPQPDDTALTVDQLMAPRKKLWETYPENIFAGMAVQEPIRRATDLTRWREWALSEYRRMHDRAAGDFLEARLVSHLEPARSLSLLAAVLQLEPDFAWAHLLAAELAAPGAEKERSLRSFRGLCEASLADAPLYGNVREAELLRTAVAAFTRILAGRTDREALLAYPHYWRMRQRAGPFWPPNWLQIEVARLRQLGRTGDPVWVATVQAGYRLLGDAASQSSLKRQIEAGHGRP